MNSPADEFLVFNSNHMKNIRTLYWEGFKLYILDQLLLPAKIKYVTCSGWRDVERAIKTMRVRGAPAIGVAGAFGAVLACGEVRKAGIAKASRHVRRAIEALSMARPTAVNLAWGLNRMRRVMERRGAAGTPALYRALEKEARDILKEDIAVNKRIGAHGAKLLKKNSILLTHCNAGALATAGYGTALGIIRSAHRQKKIKLVYVDETRPYLQGSRLTAWEMKQEKIPHILITDSMAGHFMKTGGIDAVIVGADRIAANGDTANKIGTYPLSILARYHKIPFYIAAPVSTVDLKTPHGGKIVIEERSSREVLYINNKCIAPEGTVARHPGFDVTPAGNITAIITEKGVFKPQEINKVQRK